jgi:hypothetical protein
MQPHTMSVSVSSTGKVEVNVTYGEKVPDLISGYPAEIQKYANRWFLFPTRYERDLWNAAKGMAPWARETVRQHILQQRAEHVQYTRKWFDGWRARRESRKHARVVFRQQVVQRVAKALGRSEVAAVREVATKQVELSLSPVVGQRLASRWPSVRLRTLGDPSAQRIAPHMLMQQPTIGVARMAAGSGFSSVGRPELSLTEQLARDHGIEPARPRESRNTVDHSRGR